MLKLECQLPGSAGFYRWRGIRIGASGPGPVVWVGTGVCDTRATAKYLHRVMSRPSETSATSCLFTMVFYGSWATRSDSRSFASILLNRQTHNATLRATIYGPPIMDRKRSYVSKRRYTCSSSRHCRTLGLLVTFLCVTKVGNLCARVGFGSLCLILLSRSCIGQRVTESDRQ